MAAPISLLHPLNLQIVEFLEDEHDLQFKVEFPAPEFCTACGAVGQSIRFSKKLTKQELSKRKANNTTNHLT